MTQGNRLDPEFERRILQMIREEVHEASLFTATGDERGLYSHYYLITNQSPYSFLEVRIPYVIIARDGTKETGEMYIWNWNAFEGGQMCFQSHYKSSDFMVFQKDMTKIEYSLIKGAQNGTEEMTDKKMMNNSTVNAPTANPDTTLTHTGKWLEEHRIKIEALKERHANNDLTSQDAVDIERFSAKLDEVDRVLSSFEESLHEASFSVEDESVNGKWLYHCKMKNESPYDFSEVHVGCTLESKYGEKERVTMSITDWNAGCTERFDFYSQIPATDVYTIMPDGNDINYAIRQQEAAVSDNRSELLINSVGSAPEEGADSMPAVNSAFDAKYENWRNKLLDLGKRNRLINYKDTKMSTVKITSPSLNDLYRYFVTDEHAIVFPKERFVDGESVIDENSYIKTDKLPIDLPKALRNIRNKARTALEEQGINMLYLSFGFLRYTEAAHSKFEMRAPLVLVPARLTIESIVDPFVLSLHEDEITVNPTLVFKLESEYGITLPVIRDDEEIGQYLDRVRECVKQQGWPVEEEVSLGLLSFTKINMYSDLLKHEKDIKGNPIVQAISGDGPSKESEPENDGLLNFADYEFDDKLDPKNTFQIVDADSSQQEAIQLAKRGVSFILQGPPGTGKSQTITNIIAESLAAGKKVLFVSEKQAALDVVHKRLVSAGLEDFCLVLHSYKASKRAVLDQLQKTINLASKKAVLTDEVYRKLRELTYDRDSLNEYARQLHEAIPPLGKTIYQVNGIIANLEAYPNLVFDIDNVPAATPDDLAAYEIAINKYSYVTENLKDDFRTNPWKGAICENVTNEFLHDAGAFFPDLMEKLEKAKSVIEKINKETNIGVTSDFVGNSKALDIAAYLRTASLEVPVQWMQDAGPEVYLDEVKQAQSIQQAYFEKAELVLQKCRDAFETRNVTELRCIDDITNLQNDLSVLLIEDETYSRWHNRSNVEVLQLLSEAGRCQATINDTEKSILDEYDAGIFMLPYRDILARYRTEYTSFLKVFKASYKQDKKQVLSYRKEITGKITDNEILDVISRLEQHESGRQWFEDNRMLLDACFGENTVSGNSDLQAVFDKYSNYGKLCDILSELGQLRKLYETEENAAVLRKNHFYFLYDGIKTDWSHIARCIEWSNGFRSLVDRYQPDKAFVNAVCSSTTKASEAGSYFNDLKRIAEIKESKAFSWFISLFESPSEYYAMPFEEILSRASKCYTNMNRLEEWIDYRDAKRRCSKEGLLSFINRAEENGIAPSDLVNVFKKRFYRKWLDYAFSKKPAVRSFRRKEQEKCIDDFARLDRLQFEIARERIREKLINNLPDFDHASYGKDEKTILKRELSKSRKIMPIRKLFSAIPNLLVALKPCLMMSPLSVSLFLEADTYKFDLVIFDEASQVFTENAIGAISRGKQAIIAGDSKQLPPTNFFQTTLAEGDYDQDDDSEDDLNAYESILDEANELPVKTLRWHYRSRQESLIAFSNAKIYKNSLITFPSNSEGLPNNGVEYVFVKDGFYDRGGRKGNVIEAKKVAELVFEHIERFPERSLGVIAFGEVQQMAIESALRAMRINDPSKEEFFAEDKEEAFFIKSLENVQGDERDTIIFSIGYAKDAAGVFRNQFGPLGKAGGERRLNVAITRAKFNVKLICNDRCQGAA